MLDESEISLGYLLGVLFGCLSILFFDFCFCFSMFCFCPFSLSFFPPLSPITSLLFLLSKTSSRSVVSVATTAGPSLLIVILHTFQNQSIGAFRKRSFSHRTSSSITSRPERKARLPFSRSSLLGSLPSSKGTGRSFLFLGTQLRVDR